MKRNSIDVAGPGGRRLVVEMAGPAEGEVVFVHNGRPEGRLLYEPKVEAGAAPRLLCAAGYGTSERRPGRSIGDCVEDVVPRASTIAASLPDRVRSAAADEYVPCDR